MTALGGGHCPATATNLKQFVGRAGSPSWFCLLPGLSSCQEKRLEKSKEGRAMQGWTDAGSWQQPLN